MIHDLHSTPKRILLVDDDLELLELARHLLQAEGYKVLTAQSGEEALLLLSRHGLPHLALVDFHMPPGMNGFTFARKSRQHGDFPIIMLTAMADSEKVIESLTEFADDYIVKPFKPQEMVARVERALRRIRSFEYTQKQPAAAGETLSVDFAQREATVNGDPIALTPTESNILYILMNNAGRTVTTNILLNSIWPNEEASEDRLHVHIHRLRSKIENNARQPRYILSERGEGYRFQSN
jgi:DNA-binding response OmpR family regulator